MIAWNLSLNLLSKSIVICLTLSFTFLPIRAQQSASVSDQSTSVQPKQASPTFTADGVPSCSEEFKTRPHPEEARRVGGSLLPPIPTKTPEATFSNEGRKYARSTMKAQHLKRFEAKSYLSLTVDSDGLPKDVCVINELGHGFDRQAFDAVGEYRFKPATRDGRPVPVRLEVMVNFAMW